MPAFLVLKEPLFGNGIVDLDKFLACFRGLESARWLGSRISIDLRIGKHVFHHVADRGQLGRHAATQIPIQVWDEELGKHLTETHVGEKDEWYGVRGLGKGIVVSVGSWSAK
jgi:hypothetical protein